MSPRRPEPEGTAAETGRARQALRSQEALRRVATLVAREAPPAELFAAVAEEVAHLLSVPVVEMSRYDADGAATVIGAWSEVPAGLQAGMRWPLDGPTVSRLVLDTGEAARIDDFAALPGTIARFVREIGVSSVAGVPIVVAGRVWGVMCVGAATPLESETEERLAEFTDLLATAVANAQGREDLARLAGDQVALRRVATLVAEGAGPAEVFAAVAREIAAVTGIERIVVGRFETDATMTVVGAAGEHPFQPGSRWPLDGDSLSSLVLRTGRPVTVEPYARLRGSIADAARPTGTRAGVGAPIVVDGAIWGAVSGAVRDDAVLPPDIEDRLTQFTELTATAIASTQAREQLRLLADRQAALRRVALLVAHGAEADAVFRAVCEETGRLLGAATVNLAHFTEDGWNVAVAGWSERGVHVPPGTRLPQAGDTIDVLVERTRAPGRVDSYEGAAGEMAAFLRGLGIRSEVGAPVLVDNRVWGALIAGTDEPEPLPRETEARLAGFAELIATAVANATARAELIASRARIVAAADEQRRRVVRDLHDGAQQRLVNAVMSLQLALGRSDVPEPLRPPLERALEHAQGAVGELRELAHGIHPAILTHRGLGAAVESLADRAPLPVAVDVEPERYPPTIESAAYFFAAEALTNAAKHARASAVRVSARRRGGHLVVVVEDDGVGGAVDAGASGLAGLRDRMTALDGSLAIDSPAGGGTRLRAAIPLA